MKNYKILLLLPILVTESCEMFNSDKQREREQAIKDSIRNDSIETVRKDSIETLAWNIKEAKRKAYEDSLGQIAIGEILFGISRTEFNEKNEAFVAQCNNRLGDYRFSEIKGFFYNDSLYEIKLIGESVPLIYYQYDMPVMYNSLKDILTEKFGSPTNYCFPDINQETGYYERNCVSMEELIANTETQGIEAPGATQPKPKKMKLPDKPYENPKIYCLEWDKFNKNILVFIYRYNREYYLDVSISKPEVKLRIQKDNDEDEQEKIKKAADLL